MAEVVSAQGVVIMSAATLVANCLCGATQRSSNHSAARKAICQTLLRTQTLEALARSMAAVRVEVVPGTEAGMKTAILWQSRAQLLSTLVLETKLNNPSLGTSASVNSLFQNLAIFYMQRLQQPDLDSVNCPPTYMLRAVEEAVYAQHGATSAGRELISSVIDGPIMAVLMANGVVFLNAADGGPSYGLPEPVRAAMLEGQLGQITIVNLLVMLLLEPPPLSWLSRRGSVAVALRAGRLALARLQRNEGWAAGPLAAAGPSSSGGGVANGGAGGGQGRPHLTRDCAVRVLGLALSAAGRLLSGGRQQAAWWRPAVVEWWHLADAGLLLLVPEGRLEEREAVGVVANVCESLWHLSGSSVADVDSGEHGRHVAVKLSTVHARHAA
jgi:hypothetical protein